MFQYFGLGAKLKSKRNDGLEEAKQQQGQQISLPNTIPLHSRWQLYHNTKSESEKMFCFEK